ncbi:unnamed protein product [Pedinophyceae sp. YPF-701]|nr:unnamed protein product [Pedinophyceae sp. YPF-701]
MGAVRGRLCVASVVAALLLAAVSSADAQRKYRVGALATRGLTSLNAEFSPTFQDYLTSSAGQVLNATFELVPVTFSDSFALVEDQDPATRLDFVFTNPSLHTCLESEFSLATLVTLVNFRTALDGSRVELGEFGGVIFKSRNRTDIRTLEDVRGKVLEAVSITALGGCKMQWRMMAERGLVFLDDPAQVRFAYDDFKVVLDVIQGDADVGFVRTDVIESMARDGRIDFADIEVLERNDAAMAGGFPFQVSTPLYPEWGVGVLPHVPREVSVAVFQALMALNKTHPAAVAGKYAGWGLPESYMALRNLQDDLNFISDGACTRTSQLYESVVCPPGFAKKSREAVQAACALANRPCPAGYDCVCDACAAVPEAPFTVRGSVTRSGSSVRTCSKMRICMVAEQREEFQVSVVDEIADLHEQLDVPYPVDVEIRVRAGNDLMCVRPGAELGPCPDGTERRLRMLSAQRGREVTQAGRSATLQWRSREVAFALPTTGTVVIQLFVDGVEVSQSPFLAVVEPRVCASEVPGSIANAAGECVCAEGRSLSSDGLRCLDGRSALDRVGGIAGLVPIIMSSALVAIAVAVGLAIFMNRAKRRLRWTIKFRELEFDNPPAVLGIGTFGPVLRARYRGVEVAVKRISEVREGRPAGQVQAVFDRVQLSDNSTLRAAVEDTSAAHGPDKRSLFRPLSRGVSTDAAHAGGPASMSGPTRSGLRPALAQASWAADPTVDARRMSVSIANPRPLLDALRPHAAIQVLPPKLAQQESKSFSAPHKKVTFAGPMERKGASKAASFNVEDPVTTEHARPSGLFGAKVGDWLAGAHHPGGRARKAPVLHRRSDLKGAMDLRHPNVLSIFGAVLDEDQPLLVMESPEIGSLYDMLRNPQMHTGGEGLLTILKDVACGMTYLHSFDPPVLHNDLKSMNVLVDRNFRGKVAPSLTTLSRGSQMDVGSPLWMAPERLRGEPATPASDVYSFGVLVAETYSRQLPFQDEGDALQVLAQVADRDHSPPRRPRLDRSMPAPVRDLVAECLHKNPGRRPTFKEVGARLADMESSTLTETLQLARATLDSRFSNFPPSVAAKLAEGGKVEPEHYECVSVLFADIVGYTDMCSKLPSSAVSAMLERVFSKLDALAAQHEVFRVDIIGDCYIVAGNLVTKCHDHTARTCRFAIDAVRAAAEEQVDPEHPDLGHVRLRVGIHLGPATGSVIGGRGRPRYSLFGDTVNVAARMESLSRAGCIQVTEQVVHAARDPGEWLKGQGTKLGGPSTRRISLRPDPRSSIGDPPPSSESHTPQGPPLVFRKRGNIEVKGKGLLPTYWLIAPFAVNPDDVPDHSTAGK